MSQASTTPVLLLGLVAGLVGGLLGGMVMSGPSAADPAVEQSAAAPSPAARTDADADLPAPAGPLGSDPADLRPLNERLAAVEHELALLQGQVAGRRRVDQAAPAPGAIDPNTLEPILDQAMSDFLEEREAQQAAERRQREEERRQERLDRQMERLQEQLGLTDAQAHDMQQVLNEADLKRNEFFQSLRESGEFDRDAMRDFMTRAQEETNIALGGILTVEQLASFNETAGQGMRGMFGGPGGGRTGGGRGGF
jgi:hypothetical protein